MLWLIFVKMKVQTLFIAVLVTVVVSVSKGAGESSRLGLILRFRELVLRRVFGAVKSWIWEARINA